MPPTYTKEELGNNLFDKLTNLERRKKKQQEALQNNPIHQDGQFDRELGMMMGTMIERTHSLTLDRRRSGRRTYYYN
jgi:hypothetical protein